MLNKVVHEYSKDMNSVEDFCNTIYDNLFAQHFKEIRNLYKKLKSEVNPISDSELEYILIMFPMELFTVAEKLNKLRLDLEVVKLKNKEKLEQIRNTLISEVNDLDVKLTKTEANDYVNRGLNQAMVEYDVLAAAYESVITRVTNEQTFSKELIMGAKKVWDSRRTGDGSNPVKPVKGDLPDYDPTSGKSYIK